MFNRQKDQLSDDRKRLRFLEFAKKLAGMIKSGPNGQISH